VCVLTRAHAGGCERARDTLIEIDTRSIGRRCWLNGFFQRFQRR